jgi:hypothetical protein
MEYSEPAITGGFIVLAVLGFIIAQIAFKISDIRILLAILLVVGLLIPRALIEFTDIDEQIG